MVVHCSTAAAQKIMSLSSCEAELHAIISSASDGIFYIRAVLEFALGTKVTITFSQIHRTHANL